MRSSRSPSLYRNKRREPASTGRLLSLKALESIHCSFQARELLPAPRCLNSVMYPLESAYLEKMKLNQAWDVNCLALAVLDFLSYMMNFFHPPRM